MNDNLSLNGGGEITRRMTDKERINELDKDLFAYKGSATLWEATSNQFEKRVSELEKQLESLKLDYGLLEIDLDHKQALLKSCEKSLGGRNAKLAESIPKKDIEILQNVYAELMKDCLDEGYNAVLTGVLCDLEKLLSNHKE